MKSQIISLKTAKLAKEKGFSITNTIAYYVGTTLHIDYHYLKRHPTGDIVELNWNEMKDHISASTQPLLQKWLREKHNIHIIIKPFYNSKSNTITYATDILQIGILLAANERLMVMDTFEEALEIGLQNALNKININ